MKGYRTYIIAFLFFILLVILNAKFGIFGNELKNSIKETGDFLILVINIFGGVLTAWKLKAPAPMKHQK